MFMAGCRANSHSSPPVPRRNDNTGRNDVRIPAERDSRCGHQNTGRAPPAGAQKSISDLPQSAAAGPACHDFVTGGR
jgi:hypothetical protein